jgi:hypothetical protein
MTDQGGGTVRKTAGTGGGFALATVLAWVLELQGIVMPTEVALAAAALFTLAGNWLVKRLG